MSEKNLPFWGFVKGVIQTAAGYIWIAVRPHEELFWLWAITFSLTLVWVYKVRSAHKKLFSTVAGFVIFGALTLALILTLGGWLLELLRWLWGQPWYFMIPIIVIALFAISAAMKIPGLSRIARKLYSGCKWLVMKVWNMRLHAKKHPNGLYAVFGALFIAGLVNGQLATGLTDTKDLIPGIIPGISAAAGLIILLRWLVKAVKQRGSVKKTENAATPDGSDSREPAEVIEAEPAATTASEAPAEAGCWMQCACGEMNFLDKTPQFCDVCGDKLRDFAPTGKDKAEDELSSCSAPSFREMWWDIP